MRNRFGEDVTRHRPKVFLQIQVINDGRATARNLIVQLTTDSFVDVVNVFRNGISIINNRTFDLAPGESVILALAIAPPVGLPATGISDLTGRAYNGNVTVDFVSREPTLSPLIIPYFIEFRSNSMIDRLNVSVLAEQPGGLSDRQPSTGASAINGALTPVPGAAVGLSNPFLERNKTTSTDGNGKRLGYVSQAKRHDQITTVSDILGVALFTNVPRGAYLLSIDKIGYAPFRRPILISLEQANSYKAVLEDYFTGTAQQTGANAQLVPTGTAGGKSGFQLQVPAVSALPVQNVRHDEVLLVGSDILSV